MLYNLNWLQPGKTFPPTSEQSRLNRYAKNKDLFKGEHFGDATYLDVYRECSRRITRVIGNFEDVISIPVLLNYQKLISLKIADLVCGEPPNITGSNEQEDESIRMACDRSELLSKLYATVIDISRYGDAIHRIYKDDESGEFTFTVWDPAEWFPVVSQDGTRRILYHCLCWTENRSEDPRLPDWYLHAQIFDTRKVSNYEHRVYKMDMRTGSIGKLVEQKIVPTGLSVCAVFNLKSFSTSDTIFGYDDYDSIDSILSEIMARIGQISIILDKHADPNMTGPTSMLSRNPETGEYYLKTGKFFAVSPGEEQPKYLTWEGQLDAAFKQLELLINQLYIISEMGAAVFGDSNAGSQAISGTAMRFKMVGPLAKARRIANSLTLPVKKLIGAMCSPTVKASNISIEWFDGLPDDPRENIEMAKLATGTEKLMPLVDALMEYFGKSNKEAVAWAKQIYKEMAFEESFGFSATNSPGPQDGTGVNPQKKGSETGLVSPAGQQNRSQDNNSKSIQATN